MSQMDLITDPNQKTTQPPTPLYGTKIQKDENTVTVYDIAGRFVIDQAKPMIGHNLGPGQHCQIKGCGAQGYFICDCVLRFLYCGPPIHKGCGKRLCKDHLTIQRSRHGSIRFYHCKEKSNRCENKYTCGSFFNISFFIIMFIIMLVTLAILG